MDEGPRSNSAHGLCLLDLPDHLLSHILACLSTGRALCNALEAHRQFRAIAASDPGIWAPLGGQSTWLLRCKESLDRDWAMVFRRAHCSANVQRLIAVGGDEGDSDSGTSEAVCFDPHSGIWSDLPSMHACRNAPCAAVDYGNGSIYALGGWNEDGEALTSIEVLRVPSATTFGPRDWAEAEEWKEAPSLSERRCFAAAICDESSRLWVCGGGNAMSRGAECMRTVEYTQIHPDLSGQVQWTRAAQLLEPRCGHALATDARASLLYLVGGYSGGVHYQSTVETFDMRGERAGAILPLMAHPRSGCGAGFGPDGALYVMGGSDDGSAMLGSCERFDPREGHWQALPDLSSPRGYLAAAFALDGSMYVAGGCGPMGLPLDNFEAFDTRAGRWRELAPLPTPRSNLALVHCM
jgi:hypothetical protein